MSGVFIESLESRTMLSGPPYVIESPGTGMTLGAAVPAHAVLVKDINPGPADSLGLPWAAGHASEMVAVGNQVFFDADDGRHGLALWKSDGSGAGTRMVARAARCG